MVSFCSHPGFSTADPNPVILAICGTPHSWQAIPPYRFENDKPVPRGFVIPPEDEWIDTVHKAYELLNAKDADGDTISVSRETASMLADKLNKLLKGGNKDV